MNLSLAVILIIVAFAFGFVAGFKALAWAIKDRDDSFDTDED